MKKYQLEFTEIEMKMLAKAVIWDIEQMKGYKFMKKQRERAIKILDKIKAVYSLKSIEKEFNENDLRWEYKEKERLQKEIKEVENKIKKLTSGGK